MVDLSKQAVPGVNTFERNIFLPIELGFKGCLEVHPKNLLLCEIDKSHLLELESLFGEALLSRAIGIVYGKRPIKAYCSTDGQCNFLDVPGSKYGTVYKVFPGINFCACESFRDWVLKQKRQSTCKHVLAARLALILRRKTDEPLASDSCLALKQQFVADCLK